MAQNLSSDPTIPLFDLNHPIRCLLPQPTPFSFFFQLFLSSLSITNFGFILLSSSSAPFERRPSSSLFCLFSAAQTAENINRKTLARNGNFLGRFRPLLQALKTPKTGAFWLFSKRRHFSYFANWVLGY